MSLAFLFLLIGWIIFGGLLGYRLSFYALRRPVRSRIKFILLGGTIAVLSGTFGVLINGMHSYLLIMLTNLFVVLVTFLALLPMTKLRKSVKILYKKRRKFIPLALEYQKFLFREIKELPNKRLEVSIKITPKE